MMLPQRRQMMAPQGLDVTPMQPAAPMQFAAAQQASPSGGGGLQSLMGLAQQYRAGQEAKQVAQASAVQRQETDAPRKKLPFAAIADAAQAYA